MYDTVLARSLLHAPEDLEKYYDDFLNGFYAAKKIAATYGIQIDSVAVEMLSMIRDRTCEGKIVLTPMGTISSCARVSSPKESLYGAYTYGEVKNGKVDFDNERFSGIINESNIYSQEICRNCFAKWNCGGGCRLFHHSFSPEYEKVRCDFVKKSLKRQLVVVLAERFKKNTGKDFDGYIRGKIENGEI